MKLLQIFADMEELGIRPNTSIVKMVGDVFQRLGMLDKYEKLQKKYPPPAWEYRYIKGKRVKIRTKPSNESDDPDEAREINEKTKMTSNELYEEADSSVDDAAKPIYEAHNSS